MNCEETVAVACPSCGEVFFASITRAGGHGRLDWIEDCQICCHPVHIVAEEDGEDLRLLAVEPG